MKIWEKPILIGLKRRKREEMVLITCKGDGVSPDSFLAHHDQCHSDSDPCVTLCSDISTS